MYKHTNWGTIEKRVGETVTVITPDTTTGEYQQYLSWVKQGNTAEPADPLPEPEPTRDERLLAAVAKANDGVDAALDASADFTARQKAVLKGILKGAFSSLGKAVSGEQP